MSNHHTERYWVIVASKDHLLRGTEGGFCQANHGKAAPLQRMKRGDWILFYSSKEKYGDQHPYQKFTAIGKVQDDEVYQYQMTPDFAPYRRNVKFYPCQEVEVRPLINELTFVQNKQHWGYIFRFGFFEIPAADFTLIAPAMLKDKSAIHV